MTNRLTLLGSALIGAALLCGPAHAQYTDSAYDSPRDDVRYYDERPAPAVESVIVRPDYDYIEKRQLIGPVNGERNATAYTISRPVDFADLNLSSRADRHELVLRVRDTAEELCYRLDARFPQLRGDRSADRECVRNATRNAMRDIYG